MGQTIESLGYELTPETPSATDYGRLRIVAGLSPKSAEGAAAGLPNTLFGVVVRKAGEVVGMGRAVGDGGLFFQVVDIAVEPAHQGVDWARRSWAPSAATCGARRQPARM